MVDFFSLETLKVAVIAVLAFGGLYLCRNFPGIKKALPLFKWMARIVHISLNHWGARKVYVDSAKVAERYTLLLAMYEFQPSIAVSKEWFSKFVLDSYEELLASGHSKEDALRVSNAVYVLLSLHPDILQTLKGFGDMKTMDVKRTTLIFIDFLGELFNLRSRVDILFYQDMIYGINKVLLDLKNGEPNKKTISAVTGTLWRMYQLSCAYNELKSNSSLSRNEYQKKMEAALSTLVSYFYK